MKYSIKEISELAHVAPSTVSKALNGQRGVSEEKRAEIIKIAGEHNYIPNASARALSHKSAEAIGLIIPAGKNRSLLGSYWSEIIATIAEEVSSRGYSLLLFVLDSEKRLVGLKEMVLRQNVDGLIIPAEEITLEAYNLLIDLKIPFVLQGRSKVCNHYSVDVQNMSGAASLTRSLLLQGCKKCACVAGPEEYLYSRERVEGFRTVMADSGIGNAPVLYSLYSEQKALLDIRAFFEKNRDVDGVFITAGGEFAFYVLRVLKELGFDMSNFGVSVFDDFEPLHFLPFPVTSAKQPVRLMGTQTAKNLFQLLAGEEPPSLSLFDITLVK